MTLSAVHYLMFESDDSVLSLDAEWHELDREIRLQFTDGSARFVSWTSTPVQYCIGVRRSSWFDGEAQVERDLSESLVWRDLVGKAVRLRFLGTENQVLEVSGGGSAVYCASYDRETAGWWCDVVHVAAQRPS